ncbi:hypothetical protein PROFUN_13745 [Planoprotostelium fungivorum]|uniref:UDENN domain-containing protein n=1 Tax=Planoprotostelium fungivorum TaxID=1890364 RepID=A0A2P6MWW5_9EUKA|nr:hypothetical protein PROFUN_13745 [Planoprotostelium fungivorum]
MSSFFDEEHPKGSASIVESIIWLNDSVTTPKAIHPIEIKSRYPAEDHEENAFDPGCKIFAFPGELRFTRNSSPISVHSFISTSVDGAKTYGFCCTRHRKLRSSDDVFFPEVLCIQSKLPFIQTIETSLRDYPYPNLAEDQPFPDYLLKDLYIHLNRVKLPLQPNLKIELPICNVDFKILFTRLHPTHICKILEAIMNERKILFKGSQYVLVSCIEAILHMLWPFEWPHIYIPMAPSIVHNGMDMNHVLIETCFMPFIIGVSKESLEFKEPLKPPEDVVIVDLDDDTVDMGNEPSAPWPEKHEKILVEAMSDLALICMFPNIPQDRETTVNEDIVKRLAVPDGMKEPPKIIQPKAVPLNAEFALRKSQDHGWVLRVVNSLKISADHTKSENDVNDLLEMRTKILLVLASLFRNFLDYVTEPTEEQMNDPKFHYFQHESFLGSVPESCQLFLSRFIKGQVWSWFIQEYCFIKRNEDPFLFRVNEAREAANSMLESQHFQEILWTMQCTIGGDGDRPIYLVQVEMSSSRLNFWAIDEESSEADFLANPDDHNLMVLVHTIDINDQTVVEVPLEILEGFPLTISVNYSREDGGVTMFAETSEARRSLSEAIRCIILKKRKLNASGSTRQVNMAKMDQLFKVMGGHKRVGPSTTDLFNSTMQRSFSVIHRSQPPSPRLLYAEYKRHSILQQEHETNEEYMKREEAKKKFGSQGTVGRKMSKLFNSQRSPFISDATPAPSVQKKFGRKSVYKSKTEETINPETDATVQLKTAAAASFSSIKSCSLRILERTQKMQKSDGIFLDSVLKSLMMSAEEGVITEESIMAHMDDDDGGDTEHYVEGMARSLVEIQSFSEGLLASIQNPRIEPEQLKKNLTLLSQMAKVIKGSINL